jgi:aspartate aminotransferase
MKSFLSERVKKTKPSPTLTLAAKTKELQAMGKDIIDLTLGEPDFPTEEHIKAAAINAIKSNFTKYTPVDGTPDLKKAIINKFKKENNLEYSLNQILVSAGAKHSLYNLFQEMRL